jgi:hypothetical protein
MNHVLTKRPADLRFAISVGLAVALSHSLFRHTADHFGIVVGLLVTALGGAVIALAVHFVWPAPKKASPEAVAAGK